MAETKDKTVCKHCSHERWEHCGCGCVCMHVGDPPKKEPIGNGVFADVIECKDCPGFEPQVPTN